MTKRDLQNQIDALREQIIMANGRIRALEYDFNMQTADVVELEGSKAYKCLSYTTTGIPTADVRENAHATWQRDIIEDAKSGRRICEGKWICSNCGYGEDVPTVMGEPTVWNFCPNCGAEMEGSDGEIH